MSQSRQRHPRWLKRSLVVFIAVGVLGILALVAYAHPFTDVPAGMISDAVDWVYNRSITAGCTATLYCPNDPVTRAQMALFINRLGKALSPVYRWVEANSGALDIDGYPKICTTTDFTPAFPMRALVVGTASLEAAGALGAQVALLYSTNAGVSWSLMSDWNSRVGASAAAEWDTATKTATRDLSAGTPYRFTIEIWRDSGTADATDSRCDLMVQFTNRNPDGIAPDAAITKPAATQREQRRR